MSSGFAISMPRLLESPICPAPRCTGRPVQHYHTNKHLISWDSWASDKIFRDQSAWNLQYQGQHHVTRIDRLEELTVLPWNPSCNARHQSIRQRPPVSNGSDGALLVFKGSLSLIGRHHGRNLQAAARDVMLCQDRSLRCTLSFPTPGDLHLKGLAERDGPSIGQMHNGILVSMQTSPRRHHIRCLPGSQRMLFHITCTAGATHLAQREAVIGEDVVVGRAAGPPPSVRLKLGAGDDCIAAGAQNPRGALGVGVDAHRTLQQLLALGRDVGYRLPVLRPAAQGHSGT